MVSPAWSLILNLVNRRISVVVFPLNPSKIINVHLLFTVSLQNKLFCCQNIGIDHTCKLSNMKKNILPNCSKGNGTDTTWENLATHHLSCLGLKGLIYESTSSRIGYLRQRFLCFISRRCLITVLKNILEALNIC